MRRNRILFLVAALSVFWGESLLAQGSPPVPATDSYNVGYDLPLDIAAVNGVLANDTDPDPGTVLTVRTNPVASPANGTLSLNTDGSFT
ncbi:Ig-like domain-containing protein [Robiginitalea sp. SC105]|uniref:Ig-like domain-containing protein n=1 Tax=Robiginitalea sp. SC105 TaxID=2762332 RepID=UPI00163B3012|nr:Ig-like domain-containing protein [Robiginitalea sp. SC105]MBC2838301.1 hypothetical protein [Robiginitalea sp. SC105]